jgi:hypothetical protein
MRDPACANDDISDEVRENKRVLLEHSVDLMHVLTKRMAQSDASTGGDDDALTTRKRPRAE